MDIEQKIQAIENAESITLKETQYFADVINDYFSNGRPQEFSKYEHILSSRVEEFCSFLDFNSLVGLLHNYFLFCRTNNPGKNTDHNQKEISKSILEPFLKRIKQLNTSMNCSSLDFAPNKRNVMIITRHATTQGSYAPGKQVYSVTKALSAVGYKIKIVSLGTIDTQFFNLMKNNPNIHVGKKDELTPLNLLYDLRAEILQFEPCAILSDIELGTFTAIETFGISCSTFLLSAGFYRTPWYSKKLLTEELMLDEFKNTDEFVAIPQTLTNEILAPDFDSAKLSQVKDQLNLSNKFVIASFARYEMFSEEFLESCENILIQIPNSVLILAGPNDRKNAEQMLQKYIQCGRAKLLGPSDLNILGRCCHVFLDTFPTVTGYAALESFAKGIPVFTRECKNLNAYRKNRIDELIFDTEEALVNALEIAADDKIHYDRLSVISKNFISKISNLEQLSKSLVPHFSN